MRRLFVLFLILWSCASFGAGFQQIETLANGIQDDNGDFASGGSAYFYSAGTTTPVTVYSDLGTTALANPYTLDTEGRVLAFANVALHLVVYDADGVKIVDQDNLAYGTAPGSSGTTTESFTSTAGQTVFTFGSTYNITKDQFKCWINGVKQASGTVTFTNTNATLDESVLAGWTVEFEILQ